MTPKVLNKRTCITIPPGAVYVGRPTEWGNPYTVGIDGNRLQVIIKYREQIERNPRFLSRVRKELKGKDLVCWCAPLPCHADVLLELANSTGCMLAPESRQ